MGYVINNLTTGYGTSDPNRRNYYTGKTWIAHGELHLICTEDVSKAKKYSTRKLAQKVIDDFIDWMRFYKLEIVEVEE